MKKLHTWIIAAAALTGLSSVAGASPLCPYDQIKWTQSGYMLSANKRAILAANRPLARNRSVTKAQMKTRVERHIRNYHGGLNNLSVSHLASIIANAASATGVDFSILSSLVRKESNYCEDRYNNSGGDSGCVQFTTPGLTELKHQFGIAGKGKYMPGVPDILNRQASTYFAGNPDRLKEFRRWLRLSTKDQKWLLRNRNYHDIDILAGAMLLKIYLANNSGNYTQALRQYNGSARKVSYANNVAAVSQKISYDTFDCQEKQAFPYEIYSTTCEINEDNGCYMDDPNFRPDPFVQLNEA